MMMPPALIAWPPYTLTPSRFDSESRPLRVVPPPFLCAISDSLVSGWSAQRLAVDRDDLQFGVILTMALVLLVVLAAPHLENLHLIVATMRQNRSQDRCTFDQWRTKLDGVACA